MIRVDVTAFDEGLANVPSLLLEQLPVGLVVTAQGELEVLAGQLREIEKLQELDVLTP